MDEILRGGRFVVCKSLFLKSFDKLTTHENQRRTEGVFKQ